MTYADDALVMNRTTTLADIQGFLRERLRKPLRVNDTIIWDFSAHEPNMEALREKSLHRSEYMIPYNVGPVFGQMMPMLPESVQELEILRYDVEKEDYATHHNYWRDLAGNHREDFRNELQETKNEMSSDF